MVQINGACDLAALGLGVSAGMGFVGYLGGQTAQLFIPTVSAVGYGLTLGLWPLAGAGIYALAEKINRDGGPVNVALAFVGGYFASLALTNLMGFSVSLLAPFLGVTALVIIAAVVITVAGPCLACCCGSAALGMAALTN